MATSIISSLVGWQFIPDFATRQLLPYFHQGYTTIFRRPSPPPGTPQYTRHYRYVYALVVTSYLIYNFRGAALSMPPNYYEILGVSPTSDDSGLKSAFRQFAKKYHPDRVGPQGEGLFMEVRDAFEALKNPTTRFAYDRFGPDALSWDCTTLREYVRHGLMQSSGFHITSLCILLLFSSIGKPSPVAFWRYILFALIFIYELIFILSPSLTPPSSTPLSSFLFSDPTSAASSSFFSLLWPNRVAYQHVRFLHSLSILISVALSRVAPVLFPETVYGGNVSPKTLGNELNKIMGAAQVAFNEATAMVNIELHSVHGPSTGTQPTGATFPLIPPLQQLPPSVMEHITTELENLIIEGKLRKEEGPMRSAVDSAIQRRQQQPTLTTHQTLPAFPAHSQRPYEDDKGYFERTEGNGAAIRGSPVRPGQRSPKKVIGLGWGAGSTRGSPSPGYSLPPEGYVRGRSLSC